MRSGKTPVLIHTGSTNEIHAIACIHTHKSHGRTRCINTCYRTSGQHESYYSQGVYWAIASQQGRALVLIGHSRAKRYLAAFSIESRPTSFTHELLNSGLPKMPLLSTSAVKKRAKSWKSEDIEKRRILSQQLTLGRLS